MSVLKSTKMTSWKDNFKSFMSTIYYNGYAIAKKFDKDNTEKLFNSLSPEQQKQVQNILSDKNKTEEILKSPQAQAILKKLMGGK